ncbi:MAG: tetratricopeptide repeat protein [Phycisphaeraceae bacterium]
MPTPIKQHRSRHCTGAISLGWVVLLVLLAIALSAVIYLALNRGNSGTADPPRATQEQIDKELGVLQQAFQTTLQEKQDLARLAAQARAFTEQYPEQQGGYVLLAQTRMGLKQWDLAYAAWKQALTEDVSTFEISKMAGLCAAKLGEVEQALSHYQQAVESTNDQADSEVYAALGRLHLALNDVDLAEQMFDRAVDARGPGEDTNYKHQAYAGLADVAAVREDTATALSWIDRSIKMANLDSSADSAAYHIQKARIYMDADRDQDATTMLGYTWSQYPDAPWRIESARLRAKLYERADQLDAATDYLQSITEWHRLSEERDNETLANFTALLTQWQIKANRTDDAQISLHNLQTLAPGHPAIDGLKAKLR